MTPEKRDILNRIHEEIEEAYRELADMENYMTDSIEHPYFKLQEMAQEQLLYIAQLQKVLHDVEENTF